MEDPVREIPQIVQDICCSTPDIQLYTIEKYFTPDAAFDHPICKVVSGPGSRESVWGIYNWSKQCSPRLSVSLKSIAFDPTAGRLYLDVAQTFQTTVPIPYPNCIPTPLEILRSPTQYRNGTLRPQTINSSQSQLRSAMVQTTAGGFFRRIQIAECDLRLIVVVHLVKLKQNGPADEANRNGSTYGSWLGVGKLGGSGGKVKGGEEIEMRRRGTGSGGDGEGLWYISKQEDFYQIDNILLGVPLPGVPYIWLGFKHLVTLTFNVGARLGNLLGWWKPRGRAVGKAG